MIEGLSHITLIVKDLDRMTIFLTQIFDAQEIYASGHQLFSIAPEKFFLINQLWIAIMQGDSLPNRTYNHIAFKIAESEFDRYVERVRSLDVDVKESRSRIDGEKRSIYFYDYDNHLFELHTGTLQQRLARYLERA